MESGIHRLCFRGFTRLRSDMLGEKRCAGIISLAAGNMGEHGFISRTNEEMNRLMGLCDDHILVGGSSLTLQ